MKISHLIWEKKRTTNKIIEHLENRIKETQQEVPSKRAEFERLHEYLFKIPPDFKSAKFHGKAMKVRVSAEDAKADENNQ